MSAAYPLTDGLGSTVALTDAQGRVTQRYRYTAYGTPTVLTLNYQPSALNSGSPYRFLFTGREWLASVGLNDHRNRYYSPGLGRWLTTDPIGFDGGLNLYAYVGNSSQNFRDPRGLSEEGDSYDAITDNPIWAVSNCSGCANNTGTYMVEINVSVTIGGASASVTGSVQIQYDIPPKSSQAYYGLITCTYSNPWSWFAGWTCVPRGVMAVGLSCP